MWLCLHVHAINCNVCKLFSSTQCMPSPQTINVPSSLSRFLHVGLCTELLSKWLWAETTKAQRHVNCRRSQSSFLLSVKNKGNNGLQTLFASSRFKIWCQSPLLRVVLFSAYMRQDCIWHFGSLMDKSWMLMLNSSAVTICQILFLIDKRYDKSKLLR